MFINKHVAFLLALLSCSGAKMIPSLQHSQLSTTDGSYKFGCFNRTLSRLVFIIMARRFTLSLLYYLEIEKPSPKVMKAKKCN